MCIRDRTYERQAGSGDTRKDTPFAIKDAPCYVGVVVRDAQLRTTATPLGKTFARTSIVAPTRKGIHVVQGPYEGSLCRHSRQRAVIKEIGNPVKVNGVARGQLRCEAPSGNGPFGGEMAFRVPERKALPAARNTKKGPPEGRRGRRQRIVVQNVLVVAGSQSFHYPGSNAHRDEPIMQPTSRLGGTTLIGSCADVNNVHGRRLSLWGRHLLLIFTRPH